MAYKILKKEEIAPSVHRMVIDAPDVAKAAKAGQFIILRIDERGRGFPSQLPILKKTQAR
ncbi:MAG: hypothetical protein NHB15_17005 [Methanosarcina barkeri]|nr:hypothetical protein [Methanosarcina sp. ERenArc_MAG2]